MTFDFKNLHHTNIKKKKHLLTFYFVAQNKAEWKEGKEREKERDRERLREGQKWCICEGGDV